VPLKHPPIEDGFVFMEKGFAGTLDQLADYLART
jgi:hypothetical protein